MLGQKFCHDAGRNTGFGELAIQVHAGCNHRRFDRVQHVEAGGHLAKTVPVDTGFCVLGLALDDPVFRAANALIDQLVGSPDLEPPVVAVLVVHFAHGTAEVQRLGNTFFDQRGATGWLHHCGSYIAAGNDAVLRTGAGVHQVGFVEEVTVEFDGLRVLHQHLTGLADAGQ